MRIATMMLLAALWLLLLCNCAADDVEPGPDGGKPPPGDGPCDPVVQRDCDRDAGADAGGDAAGAP